MFIFPEIVEIKKQLVSFSIVIFGFPEWREENKFRSFKGISLMVEIVWDKPTSFSGWISNWATTFPLSRYLGWWLYIMKSCAMFKCLFIKQFNWESIIFPIRWWNKNSFGAKHLFHIGVKLTRWRRFPRRLWESVNNRYQRVSQCRFQVQKTVKFPKGKLVVTHSSNYLMNENSLETVIGFKSKFFDLTPQWKF